MSELNLKWPVDEPHYVQLSDGTVTTAYDDQSDTVPIAYWDISRGRPDWLNRQGFCCNRDGTCITHDLGPVPMPEPIKPPLNLD